MTDPRIEAAARSIWMDMQDAGTEIAFENASTVNRAMALSLARNALAAADAATWVRAVPFPIPDDRMETAKNTLLCWKGGAISDEDCVGMIVCGVAALPAPPKD